MVGELAFIVPRYGRQIAGGAENLARGLAESLVSRGHRVEVWTTCARDLFTWANDFPAGADELNGVLVRRFPITSRDIRQQKRLEAELGILGRLPSVGQMQWLESVAHPAPLYAHAARHADRYDALIALPCVLPMIQYASWIRPERTILIPCLHDEPHAYIEPLHLLMEAVRGVLFNSFEEGELALETIRFRPRRSAVMGVGISSPKAMSSRTASAAPYLLYAGRLEAGKNLSLLYQYAARYVDQGNNLKLVVIGSGTHSPPRHRAFDYRGFVSEEEKIRLSAGALALCQPSLNESFSISIMESWIVGRPVIVHEACPVTRGHANRSKGGLWFRNYDEFAAIVDWLVQHPDLASRMGANGRQYVLQNFVWSAVTERFERYLAEW